MESVPPMTPEAAQASLQALTSARERIANRITSPWWYRVGTGLCMASGFVGMSLIMGNSGPGIPDGDSYPAGNLLIALGCCLVPCVLIWALRRSTGVSIDRYGPGTPGRYDAITFLLLAVAFVLQGWLGVPFAVAAAGVGAFVLAYAKERHIDALLRERVRKGK